MNEQEMIKEIWQHVMVMNREMGGVQAELTIIKWFLALLIATSIASIGSAIWSIVLSRRNSK